MLTLKMTLVGSFETSGISDSTTQMFIVAVMKGLAGSVYERAHGQKGGSRGPEMCCGPVYPLPASYIYWYGLCKSFYK